MSNTRTPPDAVNGAVGDTFVFGSCVTRDAFNLAEAPKLGQYVSRSSVASAFLRRPREPEPDYSKNPSKFQQRMVRYDWTKASARLLGEHRDGLVVVDLIDERFDLIRAGDTWVTYSPELARCGLATAGRVRLRVGDDRRSAMFEHGWKALTERVPRERLVVSEAYWAEVDDRGEPIDDVAQTRRANDGLRELYASIGDSAGHWIRYDSSQLVGASEHVWGRAPFHFVDALYIETIHRLRDIQRSM